MGLYVNFMSSFACIKASPNAPITFAMEVEPSVATVPLVLPLAGAADRRKAADCRDCCKNLYQKPFECCVFHVRYLLLSFIFFVVVSLSDAYNDKARM